MRTGVRTRLGIESQRRGAAELTGKASLHLPDDVTTSAMGFWPSARVLYDVADQLYSDLAGEIFFSHVLISGGT